VDAKRYLCAVNPGYHDQLSEDSKRSLRLQGGVFDADAAQRFWLLPGAQAAVQLRTWDDLAKQPDLHTPLLRHFLDRAMRCVRA
jgi:predicted HD phosphohydrolase